MEYDKGSRGSSEIDNLVTRKMGSKAPNGSYVNFNVTSRSKYSGCRKFSPFMLGRDGIELYRGYKAYNVENAWQYCKVYAEDADCNGDPTGDYWKWMMDGLAQTRAVRYPKGKGAKPLYSLWDGRKYSYTEARKVIYAYLYAREVFKLHEFEVLKAKYEEGVNICIYDFDAYNREVREMTLKDVIENPYMKCGHGFILEMMVRGIISIDEENHCAVFDWSKDK